MNKYNEMGTTQNKVIFNNLNAKVQYIRECNQTCVLSLTGAYFALAASKCAGLVFGLRTTALVLTDKSGCKGASRVAEWGTSLSACMVSITRSDSAGRCS